MFSKWTQHLKDEPEAKARFERTVEISKPVLDRLKVILEEEGSAVDKSELDIRIFDKPNWEHRQAFKNGYRSAYYNLIKLVDLDQQSKEPNN